AAGEMKQRISGLLDRPLRDFGRLDQPWPIICTFHSLCLRVLRHYAPQVGLPANFSIYDSADQTKLVKEAIKSLDISSTNFTPGTLHGTISNAKNQLVTADAFAQNARDFYNKTVARVYKKYQELLAQNNALDFDDLLLRTAHAFRAHPDVLRELQDRFQYLLIDEYQDTNHAQYVIAHALALRHRNMCVVGDPDQSIYGWRGADIKNILDFEKDYPNAKTIRLEQNYRSTQNILAAAGAVVENNKARKGKKLWTEADAGEMLGLYAGYDSENEALFIADTTEKYLASNPGDHVAILYRTNSQSRQIEEALRRYGRKYNVVGGFSFYQRAEIKDTVAYLKLASSNVDSVSLMRVINTPARGIGRTTVEQIERYGREHGLNLWESIERIIDDQQLSTRSQSSLVMFRNLIQELSLVASTSPLPDLIRHILDRTGYKRMLQQEKTPESETRLENLDELINAAADAHERGETLGDFLDNAALVADVDSFDEQSPVTLMTLHNAKGLEFPLVFLSGMELGLFPHSRSMNSEEALEEERRLCYVGMTRARKKLVLTWAKMRRRFGGGEQERSTASWFLSEVPEHLIFNLGPRDEPGEVDLYSERHDVRQSAKRNTYTGKTYNSLDNISQFFGERGMPFRPGQSNPGQSAQPPAPPKPDLRTPPQFPRPIGSAPLPTKQAPPPPPARKGARAGMTVEHPKYGTGTVVRREGEGDDAKITVNFPRYGLKKLVEKYAGLKRN
ncbi:MAG: ATP-dependent helicase, Rep family, partial [Candidatus Solibacter sp.]|nr:ATP-dependent helicase, Rep family [Candidatus Solibacter sp.]